MLTGGSDRDDTGADTPLRARKKAKTRSRILEVTLRLISERGQQAVTVNDIAAAAEVSTPTFYNYYPSKDAVLTECAVRGFGDVLRSLDGSPGSVPDRLRTFFQGIAAQITRNEALWRPLFEHNAYNPVRQPQLLHSPEAGTRVLEKVLREGQQRGDITRALDAVQLASVIEGVMYRALVEWHADFPEETGLDVRFERMFEFFMRAARPDANDANDANDS